MLFLLFNYLSFVCLSRVPPPDAPPGGGANGGHSGVEPLALHEVRRLRRAPGQAVRPEPARSSACPARTRRAGGRTTAEGGPASERRS